MKSFAPLAQRLRSYGPLDDAALEALRPLVITRTFAAEAWLLRAGERAQQAHWIESGLVREYYVGEGGQEHIRRFVSEGEMTGSLLDLLSGAPALTFIQALEPTRTLSFDYARFDATCNKFCDLQRVARRFTEQLYVRKAQREHEMLALGARERLQKWQREHARLDARISRKHLASYLGVTPEHLSRLKRAGKTAIRPR